MSKPPSWNEIRTNAASFAARWADETQENAEAQSFWNEFLAVFGMDRKRVATFEKRAQRESTGGRGRIDLFWAKTLVAEHKSAGKDLAHAEEQALDYLDSIDEDDFPGVVITSDFARMRVLDLGGDNHAYEFNLNDLVNEIDRFGFIAGYTKREFSAAEEAAANIEAARLMGRLYEQLANAGYEGHEASVLLTRLLFLLFGDDTGMWEKSLFTEFVETRTQPDGSDLGSQMAYLFQILDTAEPKRSKSLDELLARFPYVNGGLFHDRLNIPSFDRLMRDELLAACAFDWGTISPAIFGSMFQSVKSKEARREMGEHYTTEQNILKVIKPLFLDDLRAEVEAAKHSVQRLKKIRAGLGEMRFLDPACGCGNFLVVAYREMRSLELDILKRLRELTGESQLSLDATMGLKVSLDQFYGIEIEEWPARIAETAMFLVDHQANKALEREFGQAPDRLPIEIAATIHLGNALHADWAQILPPADGVFVLGNPPFVGKQVRSATQKQDMDVVFRNAPGTGVLDYVTAWYEKAAEYIRGTKASVAFVSTNSISQGEQVPALWPRLLAKGVQIEFAHRTFTWTSEAPGAAHVHVVIVGFSTSPRKVKRLFDGGDGDTHELTVDSINPYLLPGPVTVVIKRRSPFSTWAPAASEGSKPAEGGHLIVEPEDIEAVRADPIAAKYIRRLMGGTETINNKPRWCLWLVDASPSDLRDSKVLRERLDLVRLSRLSSKKAGTQALAASPSLFAELRQPTQDYLLIPYVSSSRRDYVPMTFCTASDIIRAPHTAVLGADLVTFGFLSSACFTAWVRTISGRLKSDYQIAAGTVYNTFPFPELTDKQRQDVRNAAQAVMDARGRYPNESLAALYDPTATPKMLLQAHQALDRVVDGIFNVKTASETARLAALLAKYAQLAAPLEHPEKAPRARRKQGSTPAAGA